MCSAPVSDLTRSWVGCRKPGVFNRLLVILLTSPQSSERERGMGVGTVRCGGEEEVETADRPQKLGQVREYYEIGERQRVREQPERMVGVQRLSLTVCSNDEHCLWRSR